MSTILDANFSKRLLMFFCLFSVEILLNHEADINVRNHKGFTPLHLAAESGQINITKLLLRRGANPHAATDNGNTALMFAAKNNHIEVCEKLIKEGVDMFHKNSIGQDAMSMAKNKGYDPLVQVFQTYKTQKSYKS